MYESTRAGVGECTHGSIWTAWGLLNTFGERSLMIPRAFRQSLFRTQYGINTATQISS